MTGTLAAALIASLVGTPHCLGMCGGFAAAAAASWQELLAYHLGRIGTYATLGALAGAFGGALPGPTWLPAAVAAFFVVWFSLAIAGWVPELRSPIPGIEKLGARVISRSGPAARFAFGVVNGLLPCGLLYAALGMAVGSGGAAQGALTLAVFGLGTVPGLSIAAVSLRRLLSQHRWARQVLALLVLVSGLSGLAWHLLAT
jgi:hypothetical protein